MFDHSICWIRRDLRLKDHVALSEATKQSKKVTVVFIFDETILNKLKDKDDRRVTFIYKSLVELDDSLKKKGSALLVRMGDPKNEIPKLAQKIKAKAVFTNRDYEPSAKLRDQRVENSLSKLNINFFDYKDQVIFEGLEVKTGSGEAYKVFTPYKNTWLSQLKTDHFKEYKPILKNLNPVKSLKQHLKKWDLKKIGFIENLLWLSPGEKAAQKRLRKFSSQIDGYESNRNIPSIKDGTSGLSVHLRFGTLSIREMVRFAKEFRSQGSRTWLSELVWRDFYHMILDQFPFVVDGCFKPEYDKIKWPGKDQHFEAWKKGETGYPIVDAAMRHFNQTGWMHNRLRMVVASFLTKDLLVHWKKGEAYFARKLLDFDLAANNGGWQWSASTGCDAQPYFRIFNPISQSEKFDPKGKFIRDNIPELRDVSDEKIHWPHENDLWDARPEYPAPIVDHSVQRIKAMAIFKKLN